MAFLRRHFQEVFFDAEHFFDGFKANADYALEVLRRAHEAGAAAVVLCDTTAAACPRKSGASCAPRARPCPAPRSASTPTTTPKAPWPTPSRPWNAARPTCRHINGYGERCGNANLCSIIPNLELKHGGRYRCLPAGALPGLTEASSFVAEVCNLRPFMRQPFVGHSAFAHKGGIHVSAVLRNPRPTSTSAPRPWATASACCSPTSPGAATSVHGRRFGFELDKNDSAVMELLAEVKERESRGYEYSSAEASFELMFFRAMGLSKQYFRLLHFNVVDMLREGQDEPYSEATVRIKVGGQVEHTAATGHGQVNALDNAIRKALDRFYPAVRDMRLSDFKVRVLSGALRDTGGTASYVRVLIGVAGQTHTWTTVGVLLRRDPRQLGGPGGAPSPTNCSRTTPRAGRPRGSSPAGGTPWPRHGPCCDDGSWPPGLPARWPWLGVGAVLLPVDPAGLGPGHALRPGRRAPASRPRTPCTAPPGCWATRPRSWT